MKSKKEVMEMLEATFNLYLSAKERKSDNVINHMAVINTLIWILDNEVESLYSKIEVEPQTEDMTEEETLNHWEICIGNIIKHGPKFYF